MNIKLVFLCRGCYPCRANHYLIFSFFIQDVQDSHIEHNDFLSVGGNQDQSAPITKASYCLRIFISSLKPGL